MKSIALFFNYYVALKFLPNLKSFVNLSVILFATLFNTTEITNNLKVMKSDFTFIFYIYNSCTKIIKIKNIKE